MYLRYMSIHTGKNYREYRFLACNWGYCELRDLRNLMNI